MEQKPALLVRLFIIVSLLFTTSLACNIPFLTNSFTGSLLAVALKLNGSPILSVYIGNPQEVPFLLPAGEYYIEAVDAEGMVYEGWHETVAQTTDGSDVVPFSQLLNSNEQSDEEIALQLKTLAGLIVSFDLAQLSYLGIASGGFTESFQTAVEQIEMHDIDPLYTRLQEIADQEESVFTAITALEARSQLAFENFSQTTNGVLASQVLPYAYSGIMDIWGDLQSFFTFKNEEDELARDEILTISEVMTQGEKEEAFFWLEPEKIGDAQNYDEFLALLQAGELEDITSIRSDLYTGGPYQGVYQTLKPDSNRPGGETIHRVGAELIDRGAKLEWALTKETLIAAFPEMAQGITYAETADQWITFVQNMYINPLGAIKDLGIEKIKEEIQENIKWDLIHAMPNLSEDTAGQMAEHLTNEIVTSCSDLAAGITSSEDSEVDCTGVGVAQYELAAQQLGLVPEQASNAETASYIVCTDKKTGLPVSIQLVEEEIETEEEAQTEEKPSPEDVDLSALAGTYIGTTNFDEVFYSLMERGECTENEVIITISEDGTVNGGLIFYYDSGSWTITTSSGTCTRQSITDVSGIFSGQITGPTGTIKLETVSDYTLYCSSGCEEEDEFNSTTASISVPIEISGDILTGSFSYSDVDIIYTIDAIKQ